jgi:serine/threonine-protein kinase HipA
MAEPKPIGILYSERLRGKEVFSFRYDDSWLKDGSFFLLDPDLLMHSGWHYPNDERENFGLFLDSSPDRWGRLLMRRREAALAREEEREPRHLAETDYLLGLYDGHRMGGLRFKTDANGPFLDDNEEMACPPWTSLRTLEQTSLRLEEEDAVENPGYLRWLNMIFAPGSSLGGSRPKASVIDTEGGLWIAKFPSKNDLEDVGGWEMVAHELALASGITMAESKAEKFTSRNHTFLTKRFDRSDTGERIHFASALTMLDYRDGQDYKDGASYLDLNAFIMNNGAQPDKDLEQLWRRIVFSICVSNTDDHLRNHGFILTERGWTLSPAYDINPVESGTGLSLNISEDDNALDLELAMKTCEHYRLSDTGAREIIDQVKSSVIRWREIATLHGISRGEQERKAPAFRVAMA